tara:strand:+ start:8239 stop:10380 length:2142 start_codon:yes stop_codon:yes gene_type:complete
MTFTRTRCAGIAAVAAMTLLSSNASAAKFLGADFSINGQFRVETAFSTSDKAPSANQFGLGSNGRAVDRKAGNPLTRYTTTLAADGSAVGLSGANFLRDTLNGLGVSIPVLTGPAPRGVTNYLGTSDTYTRYIPYREADLNYHALRFESAMTLNWSGGWSFQARLRALYDPGELGYRDFDYADYADINDGFFSGQVQGLNLRAYATDGPDYFGYQVDGERNPLLFERSGRNYSIDLPAFFVEWTNGNVTARLGNQSIAWGQLLFFRIMDVANGLDLRRHLFIDRAIEEYADERGAAPGLRVTWQALDNMVADFYATQFIPTILPNPNTAYNIVDSRFILHDNYYDQGLQKEFNYGVRLKAEFGTFNLQAMVTSRYNQLGQVHWAASGINKPLPNSNYLGFAFNTYCEASQGYAPGQGCGPLLAGTAFEVAPGGIGSAEEWFDRASYTKLDGIEGLNRAIDDFREFTEPLLTFTVDTADAANNELDAFFMAAEGLHGHVQRTYRREEVYGLGGGIVTQAELGSFFDQMLINVEATYSPDRAFTSPDLGRKPIVRDEYQVGLVVEKYHRFSQSLPATYLVFQYLWQKESSLEGLHLSGYGSENFSDQGIVLTDTVPTSDNPRITPGISGGANYFVLAALAPSNAYIFEYSIAALFDVQGGVFVQPGVQWKPRGNVTLNLLYNFVDAKIWGDNANRTFLSLIDHTDEVVVRLGYQF